MNFIPKHRSKIIHYCLVNISLNLSSLVVMLVDALKETFETISNILEQEPTVLSEFAKGTLNCSELLLILDEFKQVYIRTLQIDSLARRFDDKGSGEKFSIDPTMMEEIYYSTDHIKQFRNLDIKIAKEILDDGNECPSSTQLIETRELKGL